jgi:preprotein translocase subunit SecG
LFPVLLAIHIFICVALIIVVLMQSSKGEGLAGAFGGGGLSGAVFGGRGAASFLSKATTVLAIFFMVSCMGLSLLSAGRSTTTEQTAGTSVTGAAQEDMAGQQQAAQQQATQQQTSQSKEGASAFPEDVFDAKPEAQPQTQTQTPPATKPDSQ